MITITRFSKKHNLSNVKFFSDSPSTIVKTSLCQALHSQEKNSHTHCCYLGVAVRLSKKQGVYLSMISAKLEQIRDNRINDTPALLIATGSVASYKNKTLGRNMILTQNVFQRGGRK